jgi:hypothetical protein
MSFSQDMALRGMFQAQTEALPVGRLPPAGLRRVHQRVRMSHGSALPFSP